METDALSVLKTLSGIKPLKNVRPAKEDNSCLITSVNVLLELFGMMSTVFLVLCQNTLTSVKSNVFFVKIK